MDTRIHSRSEFPEPSKRMVASEGFRLLAGGLALFLLGSIFYGWAGQGSAFLFLNFAGLLTALAGLGLLHASSGNRR